MSEPKYMKSRFFNSQNDRIYFAEDFADYFSSFIGNGVIPMDRRNNKYLEGLKVEAKEGLSLIIKPGKAIINGYYAVIDSNSIPTLHVDPPNSNKPRIDRVVIRLDLKNRYIDLKILKGSSSSNPKPANYLRTDDYYDLVIADIYIDAYIDRLTQDAITDQRSNSDLCGWSELNINTPAIGGSYGVPGGTIIAWYPKKDADGQYKIPKGWLVCDGNNGTPDLRDKFIMGSNINNAHEIGGNNKISLKEEHTPRHKHSLSISGAGSHSHSVLIKHFIHNSENMSTIETTGLTTSAGYENKNYIETAGTHTHSGQANYSGTGEPFDIRPSFYKLVYIMKI